MTGRQKLDRRIRGNKKREKIYRTRAHRPRETTLESRLNAASRPSKNITAKKKKKQRKRIEGQLKKGTEWRGERLHPKTKPTRARKFLQEVKKLTNGQK